MGHTLWAGWYGPDAMRTSPYYLPVGHWRALGDILLAVLDPRLTPLWLAAVAGAWAVKNPSVRESGRWIAVFSILAVLNVAALLARDPLSDATAIHAPGPRPGRRPAGGDPRSGTMAPLRRRHSSWPSIILTPETWPFPAREDAIPVGPEPVDSRTPSAHWCPSSRLEPGHVRARGDRGTRNPSDDASA